MLERYCAIDIDIHIPHFPKPDRLVTCYRIEVRIFDLTTERDQLRKYVICRNQTKLNKKILENIHLGLSNFSDKEVAQFVNTLK